MVILLSYIPLLCQVFIADLSDYLNSKGDVPGKIKLLDMGNLQIIRLLDPVDEIEDCPGCGSKINKAGARAFPEWQISRAEVSGPPGGFV
jgi:hypothetical protein